MKNSNLIYHRWQDLFQDLQEEKNLDKIKNVIDYWFKRNYDFPLIFKRLVNLHMNITDKELTKILQKHPEFLEYFI